MNKSKYFKDEEFEACTPSCTRSQINDESFSRLERAREISGIPYVLSSAYRSPEWERSKGRSGEGAHTEGKAFDIVCNTSRVRWLIVFGALAAGFRRIGIAKTFVHLDDSDRLSNPCIWLY